jgi:hypothetical protein
MRVSAERQQLLLAVKSIGEAPEARTARGDDHVKTAAIRDLPRLFTPFEATQLHIGKRHALVLPWIPVGMRTNFYQRNSRMPTALPGCPWTSIIVFVASFLIS